MAFPKVGLRTWRERPLQQVCSYRTKRKVCHGECRERQMTWSSAVWQENRIHGIFDTKNIVRGLTSEVCCVWLQPVPRVSVLASCGLKFAFCDTWFCVGGFFPPHSSSFLLLQGKNSPEKAFMHRLLFCVQGNKKYTLLNLNKGPGDWKIPETLNLC